MNSPESPRNDPRYTKDYSKLEPVREGIPRDAESLIIYAGTEGAPEVDAGPLPASIPGKDTESLLGWQVKKQPQEIRPTPPPEEFDAPTVKIENPKKASFFGAIQAGREKVSRWLSSKSATLEAPRVQAAAAKYETTISAALNLRLQQIEAAVSRFIASIKQEAQEAQRARAYAEGIVERERAAQSLREREAEIKILQERFGLYLDYQA